MKQLVTMLAALTLSSAAMAEVRLCGFYARAVPQGQPNSAIFLTLRKTSDDQLALQSALSNAAGVVELDTHGHVDGVMQTHKVPQITLARHGGILGQSDQRRQRSRCELTQRWSTVLGKSHRFLVSR